MRDNSDFVTEKKLTNIPAKIPLWLHQMQFVGTVKCHFEDTVLAWLHLKQNQT